MFGVSRGAVVHPSLRGALVTAGRDAGLAPSEDLYTTPTDLFGVWSFAL